MAEQLSFRLHLNYHGNSLLMSGRKIKNWLKKKRMQLNARTQIFWSNVDRGGCFVFFFYSFGFSSPHAEGIWCHHYCSVVSVMFTDPTVDLLLSKCYSKTEFCENIFFINLNSSTGFSRWEDPVLPLLRCGVLAFCFFSSKCISAFLVLLLEWTGNVKLNLNGEIKKNLFNSNILRKPDSPNDGWISPAMYEIHVSALTIDVSDTQVRGTTLIKILCPKEPYVHSILPCLPSSVWLKRWLVAYLEVGTPQGSIYLRSASSLKKKKKKNSDLIFK